MPRSDRCSRVSFRTRPSGWPRVRRKAIGARLDERLAEARPLYRGHRWAEVTENEVRRVLRLAYEHRDVLAQAARQGMQDVREHYSHVRAAERMRDYLLSMTVTSWDAGRPHVRVRRPLGVKRALQKASAMLRTRLTSTVRQ